MGLTYDEMLEDGWERHRNGVSGWPFACKVIEREHLGSVLRICWAPGGDELYEPDDPAVNIHVPISMLTEMGNSEPDECYVRGVAVDDVAVVVGSWWTESAVDESRSRFGFRWVVILDQRFPIEERRVATFDIDMLPDVRFGHNSWRGDVYLPYALDAIERARPSVV